MPASRDGEGFVRNMFIWNMKQEHEQITKELLSLMHVSVCVCCMLVSVRGICMCVYAQSRQKKKSHILLYCSLPCYTKTGFPTESKSNHFVYGSWTAYFEDLSILSPMMLGYWHFHSPQHFTGALRDLSSGLFCAVQTPLPTDSLLQF